MISKAHLLTDLVLRDARPHDEPSIFRLIREGNINPTGVHWKRFVVIEDADERVIACGQVKPHRDGTIELASIVVESAWREKGLARRIIEHLIGQQTAPLYLMCAAHLGGLYEKFGFYALDEDEMPRYFRWVNRLFKIPEKFMGMSLLIMRRDHDME